jgi:CheY-like chemotaxis protein
LPTNVVIQQDLQDTSFVVHGDATQVHQIMLNLCTNASHAMEPFGGVLGVKLQSVRVDYAGTEIHAIKPGSYALLTVCDTGHGVDPSIRDRIFDPYFTTKGPGQGTGMGLAVVHGIVKNHGGAIEVFSQPNVRTEFRVFFPIAAVEATQNNTVTDDALPVGNERILLVDDEEMVLDIMRKTVAKLGYRVDASTDSRAALEMFREHPERYDLVVTDMTMPNLTGKQLAMEVKLIRPEIPIILCSGVNEDSASDTGIAEFAMKPLGMKQLARLIRDVLDKGHTERRRSWRFQAEKGAFVISRSDPSNRGILLDISLSGLSFKYLDAAQSLGRADELSVCAGDNSVCVDNVKCRTVSDIETDGRSPPLSAAPRRRGIQFQMLNPEQVEQLRQFIQNNAKGYRN